jgi:transcriptional regulator with GAF, ATPase, and Fis domain
LENVISRATLRAAARGERGAPILLSARDLGEDFSVARQANQNAGVQLAAPLEAEGVAANLETQTMTENLVLGDLKELTTNFQIQLIQRAISKQAGNRSAAARELGMHRSNLHRLMQRLEM